MTRHGPALLTLSGIAIAGWAYGVNYDTRAALDRLSVLRAEIAEQREALQVLRVEWAYLNAPDRLARLVAAHNGVLGLVPLVPEGLGYVAAIPYPPRQTPEIPPPAPEAQIAAAPAMPPGSPTTAAGAGRPRAAAGATGALRSQPASETVPPALEAAIAAALVEAGVASEDRPRPSVPRGGVVAVPAGSATGLFAASAPDGPRPAPLPAARPVNWSRP